MNDISSLITIYQDLNLRDVIDYDRFNQYAIVHHSSTIEGSTLTENETRVLLEDGITPKGKPLLHSLMVEDHYKALQFTIGEATNKTPISVELVCRINEQVMKRTGNMYQTAFGQIDASRGMFRKGNVSAGGNYFINYDKVPAYTAKLVERLQAALNTEKTTEEKLKLSFAAHFDLVSIHPYYDGNGRTSRLLMNFIQQYYSLPLARVYLEDKADYFTALQETRRQENLDIFHQFMFAQYSKFLNAEIAAYRKMTDPGPTRFTLFL